MSVYIKGMKMPESCSKCFVNPACCPAIRKRLESKYQPYTWIPANYRHEDCPLVELPEVHGRLIDADAVSLDGGPYEYDEWCKWALEQYQDAPTVIDAEGDEV